MEGEVSICSYSIHLLSFCQSLFISFSPVTPSIEIISFSSITHLHCYLSLLFLHRSLLTYIAFITPLSITILFFSCCLILFNILVNHQHVAAYQSLSSIIAFSITHLPPLPPCPNFPIIISVLSFSHFCHQSFCFTLSFICHVNM